MRAAKTTGLWRRAKRRWRRGYVRVLRSPGAPRDVAGGMAVGLFLAMLPIIQTPVVVGVIEAARRIFKRPLSRVSALAGVFLTNPVTGAPLYGLALLVGRPFARVLLPEQWVSEPGTALSLSLGSAGPFALELFTALLIGGALLGLPIALVGYRLTHALVKAHQARRARRKAAHRVLSARLTAARPA